MTYDIFWGKVHWRLGPEGWPSRWFIFIKTELKFFVVTDAVFRPEMWGRAGRTGGRTEASPRISVYFFPYKLPKTVTVTTFFFFGHVALLCGKFIFINLSEGPGKWPNQSTSIISFKCGIVMCILCSGLSFWSFHCESLCDFCSWKVLYKCAFLWADSWSGNVFLPPKTQEKDIISFQFVFCFLFFVFFT